MNADHTPGCARILLPGTRVWSLTHPTWGTGRVTEAREDGNHDVDFTSLGARRTVPVGDLRVVLDTTDPLEMGGSDSPHVADASAHIQGAFLDDTGPAVAHALLAIADELAAERRERHADAIDLANAVAALTGVLGQPERVYVGTVLSRWGHLRRAFGGAR